MKALFMSQPGLNDIDGANSALSTALCLWRQCPDAWLTWGQLCDRRYEDNPAVSVNTSVNILTAPHPWTDVSTA